MKKTIILLSAILAFAFSANAQKSVSTDINDPKLAEPQAGRRILINKFSENWEVSARFGTQAYLGEYSTYVFKFKDWWNFPTFDIGVQKWGTNAIGFAMGATFSPYKGLRSSNGDEKAQFMTADDPFYDGNKNYKLLKGSMGNVYISVLLDACNIFGGYKPDRTYTLIASIGGGVMFPTVPVQYKAICASFNAGLINRFRLTKHLYLDLDIRGTLHDDMFNGISFYTSTDRRNISVDATIGATVGLTYKFNWTKSKTVNAKGKHVNEEGWTTVDEVVKYTPDYQTLKAEAAAATAAVAASSAALAKAKSEIKDKEKVIEKQEARIKEAAGESFSYKQFVNFVIDKWELSNREKVAILLAADVIKEHPDVKFLISGFADKQTASPAHNKKLSENRANAVYNCLVKEFGVNPDQLQKADYGGVDYMYFNDKQCSRAVLITAIEK